MARIRSVVSGGSRFTESRVIVTGGAGFLGSHLCDRLLAEGAQVLALDNFITGSHWNLAHLRDHPRFAEIRHDISQPFDPPFPPTAVLHLASLASPAAYMAHPIETMLAGSMGTMNALEIAGAASATFLLASTSEVYGDPEVHPQPEWYRGSVSTTGPRASYDESKRYAEALASTYRRIRDVDVRIVRIFNTYGPRLRPGDGRVVPNFIMQALTQRPLTIYGDGAQTRSFCYVTDLIDGILTALLDGDSNPVNLGNPDERSVLELAHLVKTVTGSTSSIIFEPAADDDPQTRRPDISHAHSTLGWKPTVPLELGIRQTIAWFRDQLALFPPGPADEGEEEVYAAEM